VDVWEVAHASDILDSSIFRTELDPESRGSTCNVFHIRKVHQPMERINTNRHYEFYSATVDTFISAQQLTPLTIFGMKIICPTIVFHLLVNLRDVYEN
jgi:hypothetical protein